MLQEHCSHPGVLHLLWLPSSSLSFPLEFFPGLPLMAPALTLTQHCDYPFAPSITLFQWPMSSLPDFKLLETQLALSIWTCINRIGSCSPEAPNGMDAEVWATPHHVTAHPPPVLSRSACSLLGCLVFLDCDTTVVYWSLYWINHLKR